MSEGHEGGSGEAAELADRHESLPVRHSEVAMHGLVWDVVRDRVDLGEAGEVTREYVRHPGAVAVAALDDEGRLCLIQQYRHPVRAFEWEIPAGLLDVTGEPPHVGAARELHEEADLTAATWHVLADYVSSPGGLDEALRIYLARDLAPVPESERHARDGEELGMPVRWAPLEEVRDAVLAGRVSNATVAIAVLAALAARDLGWATLRAHDAPWPSHPAYRGTVTRDQTQVGAVVPLTPNTPRRFYRGGERILAFRGLEVPDDFDGRRPEDWLASTTQLFAEGGDGLTVLPDGRLLADALEQDAVAWLGEEHLARHGAAPGLLVKLLDAGERLPVHSHPDRAFATRHLDCAHGKTEAWLVVDAEPGAMVWVGFREDVDADHLAELVQAQDDRLLALLNGFEVQRGDAVLVPAGQPHAIGSGVLVVELQEPTDFSVMLEHERFGIDTDHAWLGLDPQVALESVARTALDDEGIRGLRTRWLDGTGVRPALPPEAAEYFLAEVVQTLTEPAHLDAGFSVLVVVDGAGTLRSAHQEPRPLRAGQTLLVPHAAGDLVVEGAVTVLRCSPSREPSRVRA